MWKPIRSYGYCLFLIGALLPHSLPAQDMPGGVPDMAGEEQADANSLARMLRMDLTRRFLDIQSQNLPASQSRRPARPRSDLGGAVTPQEPIDLSRYIGPGGDQDAAMRQLMDSGRIPQPNGAAPSPPSQPRASESVRSASPGANLFKDVPLPKRLDFAEDLLKQRSLDEALAETESILDQKLKGPDLLRALTLREKILFEQGRFGTVETDYYRLKAYYPKEKRVDELKQYLEKQSGIEPLQQDVLKAPGDPDAQTRLLNQYTRFGWLNFAEEFFAKEINNTSEATVKSLSEIYHRKQDYPLLVELSRAAQKMYPDKADFYYNEGVGLFNQGDPLSLSQAQDAFLHAAEKAPSPFVKQGLNWYMQRLPPPAPSVRR